MCDNYMKSDPEYHDHRWAHMHERLVETGRLNSQGRTLLHPTDLIWNEKLQPHKILETI